MSDSLDIGTFPLYGSRLIEASAGTGKTWTIALLYTRLILQHGHEHAFNRALTPEQILVVTFTDAATQELKDRIRARLSEAARCFMEDNSQADPALLALRADFTAEKWPHCARLLSLAAQSMDQAAVSTIHSWCYRMLREHAFDSGSLFQQTLITHQRDILAELIRDYWRQHFYTLTPAMAALVQAQFNDPDSVLKAVRPLINKTHTRLSFVGEDLSSASDLRQSLQPFVQNCERLEQLERDARTCWLAAHTELELLLDGIRPALNQKSYDEAKSDEGFSALKHLLLAWANGGERPKRFERFADGFWKLKKVGKTVPDAPQHPAFSSIAALIEEETQQRETIAPGVKAFVLAHARQWLEQALQQRLQDKAELGFDDLLLQLDKALRGPQGEHLAKQIRADFPVAMIDEFQDTDPLQYRIFDRIYQLANSRGDASTCDSAIILIGDPKQAIYSFRNADIHTYLQARRATEGRHYNLAVNYRSSSAVVEAVNYVFAQAENFPAGAFRFKTSAHNPLPYLQVAARGRDEQLMIRGSAAHALNIWLASDTDSETSALPSRDYKQQMAANCAATIAGMLNAPNSGFLKDTVLTPLRPNDIAILVRDRRDADDIRKALAHFSLPSVYLSDRESVFNSQQATDVLYWLSACADPANEQALRAALATVSLALPIADIQRMLDDEFFWEEQTAVFRQLHNTWRTQGVLAMMRAMMQHYQLPQRLINTYDGERSLTNLLHLAEYLQKASQQHDGEQALIRHLAEQIADPDEEEILRLESDDDLIRVVTIHKSKGLEYPLVFLPFAAAYRAVNQYNHEVMIVDEAHQGQRRLEISGHKKDTAAWKQADDERLAEDIRLLYVALTRAQHAIWLGVASISVGNSTSSSLHLSALGYLMAAGKQLETSLTSQILENWTAECAHIHCEPADAIESLRLTPAPAAVVKTTVVHKSAEISDRSANEHWWIASYSSLKTRGIQNPGLSANADSSRTPDIARDDQVMEESAAVSADNAVNKPTFSRQNAGLHGFYRGPEPGTFLHGLLEWCAETGFANAATNAAERRHEINAACELRGWQQEVDRLDGWLAGFVNTPFHLPALAQQAPVILNLCELDSWQAELEFLFAAHELHTEDLDRLCQHYLLPAQARPALQASQLNGMIKGFIDLVFLDKGRYYVADWKSNYLGATDADYTAAAIETEVLNKRYDVQYAIYLLALHRLLSSRLTNYDYDVHVGGAVYFFLRGWQSPTQGLLVDKPPRAFINALNQLFLTGTLPTELGTDTTKQVQHV